MKKSIDGKLPFLSILVPKEADFNLPQDNIDGNTYQFIHKDLIIGLIKILSTEYLRTATTGKVLKVISKTYY